MSVPVHPLPSSLPQMKTPQNIGPSNATSSQAKIDDDFDYPFCDDVSKYEKLTKIGQGESELNLNKMLIYNF